MTQKGFIAHSQQQNFHMMRSSWPPPPIMFGLRHTRIIPGNVATRAGESSSAEGNDKENLSEEFEQHLKRADPQKSARVVAHLNLVWSVSERKRPERCDCCTGAGETECLWCHGTGAMTIGDLLFCDDRGCRPCPVCHGTGSCKCQHCRGTGKRAAWMASGECPTTL